MKILIFGSEGFIGKHSIQHFLSKGHDVTGVDLLDLKESSYEYRQISRLKPDFAQFFRLQQYDVCINAAGSGSVPMSFERPLNDFEANTFDVFHLLESIRQLNPRCKYINFSSAAVYGNPKSLPISEDSAVSPLSPYGWHKYYSELLCKQYAALYGLQTCSVRPFSVYGPGLKKQLFWDTFQKSKKSNDIVLFGTGDESRDFIYIDDLIGAVDYLLINGPLNGEALNIASGEETTIRYITKLFCQKLNPLLNVTFNGISKQGDPLNWKADITKLTELGFRKKVDIESGLDNLVKWLKN
jgi:UDP-glucose 4-epimerase